MKAKDIDVFLGLPKGSFDHIPIYARESALEAIARVRDLEEKELFRPGLYYIVLTDLTASTSASKALGFELNSRRVQAFITATVESLGQTKLSSYAHFLKDIGDAALFIFSSFNDLYKWWENLVSLLVEYNQDYCSELTEEEFEYFELKAKTAVHLGEVAYDENRAPLTHAVNQVFKIEKAFKPFQLGCTDAVRVAVTPILNQLKITAKENVKVVLPGEDCEVQTWVLAETLKP